MRLAYLTTEYPKISHTFIRREILELERRGHSVLRLAIRGGDGNIVDSVDRREADLTVHFMRLPKREVFGALVKAFVLTPVAFSRALSATVRMSMASERGLIRHLAYLVEAVALAGIAKERRVEHVHVHFGTNAAAVARLMYMLGGPSFSMTIHGPVEFDAPLGFSLSEKVADAKFVVAISDFCRAQLYRWAREEHWSKIHVVHCSPGDAYFAVEEPVDESSRMIASVGRLDAQKGQLLLIEAVRQVVRDGVDLQLVLVGDGGLRQTIEAKIRQYELDGHVVIAGWMDERSIIDVLKKARAVVQPSFAEGLPVVIMEALAMARPVISTHVAAIPELIREGHSGWLVCAGDVDELVVAIKEVMAMPQSRLNEMGSAGQRRTRERHSLSAEVAKLEALFQGMMSGIAQ